MKNRALGITAVILALLVLGAGTALAQGVTPPGITVELSFDHPAYLAGEPVMATLTLQNGAADVVAQRGFMVRDFSLDLVFTDEDGDVITTLVGDGEPEPEGKAPPHVVVRDEYVYVDEVETVPAGWSWSRTFDATALYNLTRLQHHTGTASVPIRTYAQVDHVVDGAAYAELYAALWWGNLVSGEAGFGVTGDGDADGYLAPISDPRLSAHPENDCDDADPSVNPGAVEVASNGRDDDCDPATPDVVPAPPGSLSVQADRHEVGAGNHPGSVKTPLADLPVRVYDKSPGSCASGIGIAWQTYEIVWKSCRAVPGGVARTDGTGAAALELPPGDYLLIGMEDQDGSAREVPLRMSGDEIFIGRSVGAVGSGETVEKYLQIIAKADGRTVPAKYEVRTGSLLLIIEPEYAEWDGATELYPFIFETLGDWSVTTSVTPPEGFVADEPELTAEVDSSIGAVQFVITDVGSRWVDTEVTHKIKHKGRSETIRSRVGVKLSERLSHEKGIGRFGDEPPPGLRKK